MATHSVSRYITIPETPQIINLANVKEDKQQNEVTTTQARVKGEGKMFGWWGLSITKIRGDEKGRNIYGTSEEGERWNTPKACCSVISFFFFT